MKAALPESDLVREGGKKRGRESEKETEREGGREEQLRAVG